MTGHIRKFNEPSKPVKIVGAKMPEDTEIQRPNKTGQTEPTTLDIRHHEEVIIEGQGKIRRRKQDGNLDLRYRAAKNRAEWEKVKRDED
jgi:hypothetical protein